MVLAKKLSITGLIVVVIVGGFIGYKSLHHTPPPTPVNYTGFRGKPVTSPPAPPTTPPVKADSILHSPSKPAPQPTPAPAPAAAPAATPANTPAAQATPSPTPSPSSCSQARQPGTYMLCPIGH